MSIKLLTIDEVAKLFRVSDSTVRRMMESRIIPFYRIRGNIRFKEEDMEAYLESQLVKPVDERFYLAKRKSHPQR